jgi:AcrR family transcriptional regulator
MTTTHVRGNDGDPGTSYRQQLADQKRQTRGRILASAREVFLRSGFKDANLNEVARGADVGKGTLYRHFESKGELYMAMLSQNGETLAREMAEVIDVDGPALKQIEQIAHFYLEFWQRNPDHFQLVRAAQNRELVGELSPELMAHLRRVFETPLRALEALIRRGIARGEIRAVDPWNTANALALGTNGVVGPMLGDPLPVVDRDLRAVYRQLQDVLIAGLEAHGDDRD